REYSSWGGLVRVCCRGPCGWFLRFGRGAAVPRLLVDQGRPPAAMALACEMIEPRHRAIVDGEGKPFFNHPAKRKPDRGLDGAAMRRHDHIASGMRGIDAIDRRPHAIVDLQITLAAGGGNVDRRDPVPAALDGE